jgi:hypothetical protein
MVNEPLIFQNYKQHLKIQKKNEKKVLDVDNVVFDRRANSSSQNRLSSLFKIKPNGQTDT